MAKTTKTPRVTPAQWAAKHRAASPPAGDEGTPSSGDEMTSAFFPSTASYSTRLDPSQRECVEAAAKLKKWSPAKLIREAAVSRAAHILNASSGTNRARLRDLARVVVRQLFDPTYKLSFFSPPERDQPFKEEQYSYLNPTTRDDFLGGDVCGAAVQRPSDPDLAQIKEALRTCASEFIELALEEWHSYETSQPMAAYEPQIDVGQLLGDHDSQRTGEGAASGETDA